jgi:hypothetical protein
MNPASMLDETAIFGIKNLQAHCPQPLVEPIASERKDFVVAQGKQVDFARPSIFPG